MAILGFSCPMKMEAGILEIVKRAIARNLPHPKLWAELQTQRKARWRIFRSAAYGAKLWSGCSLLPRFCQPSRWLALEFLHFCRGAGRGEGALGS